MKKTEYRQNLIKTNITYKHDKNCFPAQCQKDLYKAGRNMRRKAKPG